MQEADDFSGFQMERLLKRRNLQQRLNEVVKEIGQKTHEQFALNQGDVAESHKIASDNSTHYVLIKKALEHSTSPTKIVPKKATDAHVIGQSTKIASISENLSKEQIFEVDDGFSQQELFAIFGNEQKKEQVVCISSSSDDSDFEEVLSAVPSPVNRVVLDIPINPALAEEDDMFADIFASAVPSKIEKSTHRLNDLSSESDLSMEESDVLVMKQTSCLPTESLTATTKSAVLNSTNISTNLEKENIQVLLEKTPSTPEAKLQFIDENPFENASPRSHTKGSHSFPEVSDVIEVVQNSTLENSAFVEKDVSPSTQIKINSTEESHPCENVTKAALINTNEEISEVVESLPRNDFNEHVEESFEVPHVNITGESSRSHVAFEILPSNTKFNEPQVMPTTITAKRKEELEEMGRVINEEQSILIQQHGRQERLASSITDQMYSESQVIQLLVDVAKKFSCCNHPFKRCNVGIIKAFWNSLSCGSDGS